MNIHTEVKIPFSGFFNSLHDSALDFELEMIQEDLKGVDENILQSLSDFVDWKKSQQDYIKKYLSLYLSALESETSLEFHPKPETLEMQSPREYNFTTDCLFVKLPLDEMLALLKKTFGDKERKAAFEKKIKEMFTSCDGFISYYPNDWRKWGSVFAWDHNQWGALLASWKEDDGEFYGLPDHVEASLFFNEEGEKLIARCKEDLRKLEEWRAMVKA